MSIFSERVHFSALYHFSFVYYWMAIWEDLLCIAIHEHAAMVIMDTEPPNSWNGGIYWTD